MRYLPPLSTFCLALALASPAATDPFDPGDYFPLPDGATWTYDTELGPVTLEVQPGTVDVNGTATKERRSIAGDEAGSASFFTSVGGVRQHREFDAVEGFAIDFVPPLLIATDPSDLGQTLNTTGDLTVSGLVVGDYTLDWEITAMGAVDTPAGFFCDVVVRDQVLSGTLDGEAFPSVIETQWLVRDLGVVAVIGFDDESFFATLTDSSLPIPPLDTDCDGNPDAADLCPFWAESDPAADADGNGIGDECECGDQTGDGFVNIGDILAINEVIFALQPASPLCDANGDGNCNVADILGVNLKIFGTPASCSRHPAP